MHILPRNRKDTKAGLLRLPANKLARLLQALHKWSGRKSAGRGELELLIGTLQHACKVMKLGRSPLRRMIDLLWVPRHPHHFVCLNQEFCADLQSWLAFTEQWNGVAVNQADSHFQFEVPRDIGALEMGARAAGSNCHGPTGQIVAILHSKIYVLC